MMGGDIAVNVRTGEYRLVIEVDRFHNEVTFSGSMKWESSKDWRASGRHMRLVWGAFKET